MSNTTDDHDAQILKAMQEDNKQTHQEIAQKIGVSQSTVTKRIKYHREAGNLQDKITLDARAFGYPTLAFIQYKLHNKSEEAAAKVVSAIAQYKNVQEIHHVNGKFDLLVKLRCEDPDCVHTFNKTIAANSNVADSLTIFAMHTERETTFLDVSRQPPQTPREKIYAMPTPAIKSANED